MSDGPPRSPGATPKPSRAEWDVDAQYTVPVGPDLAVDGTMAGINAVVRSWRWVTARLRRRRSHDA